MLRRTTCLSVAFAAGALGGFANALVVWMLGAGHITGALGIDIAPTITAPFIYSKMVWGGLWGFLFILPWMRMSIWLRGIVYSLLPSVAALLIFFPMQGWEPLGLDRGGLTPLFVLVANAVWGIVTAWWVVEAAESRGACRGVTGVD